MRQEMIGFWDGTGISWTICKQSAPRSRQITTPTPYHSIFTGRMLFLTPNEQCQSTEGELDEAAVKRVLTSLGVGVQVCSCTVLVVVAGCLTPPPGSAAGDAALQSLLTHCGAGGCCCWWW